MWQSKQFGAFVNVMISLRTRLDTTTAESGMQYVLTIISRQYRELSYLQRAEVRGATNDQACRMAPEAERFSDVSVLPQPVPILDHCFSRIAIDHK